jgi:hypothetical protein
MLYTKHTSRFGLDELLGTEFIHVVWSMDKNDEESDNSSENSFNELVTAA